MLKYSHIKTITKNELGSGGSFNYWDVCALAFIFAGLVMLGWGGMQMTHPFNLGHPTPITLDPKNLPYYALRTVMRMFVGLTWSLLATFIFGTWAAKSKYAERVIIPAIDILQSVPVLSFLTITVTGFIALFKGSMLGPECAAIFLIFTAQAWNMILSFYQSLRTLPSDLTDAADMLQLSVWQRYWRVEVPFAMPGLLWNTMLSMSASWFFVVASESITVANQNINLPGIGSYIGLALMQQNIHAVGYAVITMFVVILLYDQLLFRPLNQWTDQFKYRQANEDKSTRSWVITLFQRTRWLRRYDQVCGFLWDAFVNFRWLNWKPVVKKKTVNPAWVKWFDRLFQLLLVVAVIIAFGVLGRFIFAHLPYSALKTVAWLGLITGGKVMLLIFLCTLIWVPIGVWIGLRPKVTQTIQPIIQFVSAFPANLLYPVMVLFITRYHLNVNVWTAPLIVLGTQWYILFNVIAGVSVLPKEMSLVMDNFQVGGWLWWRRLMIPAVFPYYLTGAITAAGGAWNASVVAEYLTWGKIKIIATGLGGYINNYSVAGDFPRVILGTVMMSVFVLLINYLVWRPLYNYVKERFMLN